MNYLTNNRTRRQLNYSRPSELRLIFLNKEVDLQLGNEYILGKIIKIEASNYSSDIISHFIVEFENKTRVIYIDKIESIRNVDSSNSFPICTFLEYMFLKKIIDHTNNLDESDSIDMYAIGKSLSLNRIITKEIVDSLINNSLVKSVTLTEIRLCNDCDVILKSCDIYYKNLR